MKNNPAAKKEYKKVVLAYSGGLDTSVIIPWLKENYNCEVIAVAADVGQGAELDGLEAKALKTGASKLYIEDLKEEFVDDFIVPTLQAGAKYENTYLLGTSFARPVIAKRIVEIALKHHERLDGSGYPFGIRAEEISFPVRILAVADAFDAMKPQATATARPIKSLNFMGVLQNKFAAILVVSVSMKRTSRRTRGEKALQSHVQFLL